MCTRETSHIVHETYARVNYVQGWKSCEQDTNYGEQSWHVRLVKMDSQHGKRRTNLQAPPPEATGLEHAQLSVFDEALPEEVLHIPAPQPATSGHEPAPRPATELRSNSLPESNPRQTSAFPADGAWGHSGEKRLCSCCCKSDWEHKQCG